MPEPAMRRLTAALAVALAAPLFVACSAPPEDGLRLSLADAGPEATSAPCFSSNVLDACSAAQTNLAHCCAPDGGAYTGEASPQKWCELMAVVSTGDAGPEPECLRLADAACADLQAQGVCP
jgi:hypothetical protein